MAKFTPTAKGDGVSVPGNWTIDLTAPEAGQDLHCLLGTLPLGRLIGYIKYNSTKIKESPTTTAAMAEEAEYISGLADEVSESFRDGRSEQAVFLAFRLGEAVQRARSRRSRAAVAFRRQSDSGATGGKRSAAGRKKATQRRHNKLKRLFHKVQLQHPELSETALAKLVVENLPHEKKIDPRTVLRAVKNIPAR